MNKKTKKEILSDLKLNFYKELKKYSNELNGKKELEGYANSIIIGEKNYPNIKINSISNNSKSSSFLNNNEIIKKNYSEIIKIKAKNILGSTNNINIKKINSKINEEIINIYKSRNEVKFTTEYENELKFNKIISNKTNGLIGSKNELKNISINENTKTSKEIEKYSQKDIKSKEAIINLYEKGINENQIINLLSLGVFGIEINKKLVPSKWAITAYDRTIENYLFKKIKKYKNISKFEIYTHAEKGNFFTIILFPDYLSGELIETMKNWIGNDYFNNENKLNKKKPEISGAYYAAKLAIFEFLNKRKKQSSFLLIRNIIDYEIPLGVIFVREIIRETLKKKPLKFSNILELEKYLLEKDKKIFKLFINSRIKKEFKNSIKLNKFF